MKRIVILLVFMTLATSGILAQEDLGKEIMTQVENRPVLEKEYSMLTMILTDRRGRTRERSLELYRLDSQGREYSMMFFLDPADVEGVGFLSMEDEQEDNQQWLFMPALGRTRRIASSSKDESFMGSDFSYEDLEPVDADEDRHNYLGEEEWNGFNCKMVESVSIEESSYSKSISWIDIESLIALRVDFYGSNDRVIKRLTAEDIRFENGVWSAYQMIMEDLEKERSTTLLWDSVESMPTLSPEDFSVMNLEGGGL